MTSVWHDIGRKVAARHARVQRSGCVELGLIAAKRRHRAVGRAKRSIVIARNDEHGTVVTLTVERKHGGQAVCSSALLPDAQWSVNDGCPTPLTSLTQRVLPFSTRKLVQRRLCIVVIVEKLLLIDRH